MSVEHVLQKINNCSNFKERDKETIIRMLSRYEQEPFKSKANYNPLANTLQDLIMFSQTIEGSHFWNEINYLLGATIPPKQIQLEL